MRTIAVVNQKGGTGKTTTTVNVAAALAERKRRVVVVDLDAQASATAWLGVAENARTPGALEVLRGEATWSDVARASAVPGVDIVPARRALAVEEPRLAQAREPQLLLRKRIGKAMAKRWDYLLIDCPPTTGLLAINALAAARELLVPVEARYLALEGLKQMLLTMDAVRDAFNPDLALAGIVAVRVDTRTRHAQDMVDLLRRTFGKECFRSFVRESIRVAESPERRRSVLAHDPAGHGAADYRGLAAEILAQEP